MRCSRGLVCLVMVSLPGVQVENVQPLRSSSVPVMLMTKLLALPCVVTVSLAFVAHQHRGTATCSQFHHSERLSLR